MYNVSWIFIKSYLWFLGDSQCSAKCGSGVQTRKVFCGTYDDESVKKVPDEKCDASKKFNETKNCTAEEECKGEWFAGPWSKVIYSQKPALRHLFSTPLCI